MRPVKQTRFAPDKGNCLAATVASLLELPIEEVPNFCWVEGECWWHFFQRWLGERGLFAVEYLIDHDQPRLYEVPDGTLCLLAGKSPRGSFLHSVVGRVKNGVEFELVHDPHPDDTFLDGPPSHVTFLAALNPEKFVERAA